MLLCFIYFKKSVKIVSGMSKVWENTNGCDNQYRCALDVYIKLLCYYLRMEL